MEEVLDLSQARRLVAQLRGRVDELRAELGAARTERDAQTAEANRLREEVEGLRDAAIQSGEEFDKLRTELWRHNNVVGELSKQVAHWKANHADLAARNAMLSQRPDLPVDRITAYDELVRLQKEREEVSANCLQYLTERNAARQEVHVLQTAQREQWERNRQLEEGLGQERAGRMKYEEALGNALGELETVRSELALTKMDRNQWKREAEGDGLIPSRPWSKEAEMMESWAKGGAVQADDLSTKKALDLIDRTGTGVTGYVLQAPTGGGACIIHLGAVRWLGDEELRAIVHPGQPDIS